MILRSFFQFIACLLFGVAFFGCGPEEPSRLSIGSTAPDFTASDIDQHTIHLADWRGKPVILRFWSTDCEYCRIDTPVFNRYFDKYKGNGLRVVYINTEKASRKEVQEYVRDLEIGFPVILGGGDAIAEQYRVKLVPQTIIIDPQGTIVTAILGGVGEGELEKLVGRYFKQETQ